MNAMVTGAENLCVLVQKAQAGDDEAFGRILLRFQDFAYATALRYLGDHAMAQDAAQEAFLDAYRSLPHLREAAAFPAWLRRIVVKHSDRQVRGKRPQLVALEDASLTSEMRHQPHTMLEQMQQTQAVRAAVNSLPELYRGVTQRFYLHNRSIREIALDLDLSLSTVKKRLFTARQQLKDRIKFMSTTYTPSQDDSFANRVQFAIALKKQDLIAIRRLLNRQPDLAAQFSEWGVGSDGWYFPLGYTALHFAAGIGATDLVMLLVEAGTDVNVRNKRQSTPLGEAISMNRPKVVQFLLENGADPNLAAHNGITPLHQAVIHNRPKLAQRLLEAGANVEATDQHGRSPLAWAYSKRAVEMVALLGGVSAEINPTMATPSVTNGTILETGIKVIDMMVPFKRGGNNALLTPVAGIGHDVTVAELMYNFANFHGGRSVQIGLEHGDFTEASRNLAWRDCCVEDEVETFFGKNTDSDAKVRHLCEKAFARAMALCAAGQDVLITIYEMVALREGVMSMLNAVPRQHGKHAITVLISGNDSIGNEAEAIMPLDAALTFDRTRAKQGFWPAIDPVRSYANTFVDESHAATANAIRRLFASYIDWHPIYEKMGMHAFDSALYTEADRLLVMRARRLHRFLSQPFHVVERYWALSAEFIPYTHTIAMCQRILAGDFDDTLEDDLYMMLNTDATVP
ncbi:MAG: sigma-70 family RNA polymerase sigma factor [Candidatus Promineifilaceae bacterium]